ncbi:m025L [Myxoma virus]|uniref:Protein OPG061 n=1 Tax=Myxoma virus TaxID=10273 RepID=K4J296_9POXV|nr:m025L [Myxoma virus]AFU77124.1 m025L [Myxoma virus]AFU77290.1 m025L [Myxoma virus]AFU77457.1 m025L [Myxoma virus]AFU77959.1 m025L [Myxoma virus]
MESAAIISSVISLFDTSLQHQVTKCEEYCGILQVQPVVYIQEFGYIHDATLKKRTWKAIQDNDVTVLIFYQVKQLSISAEKLYNEFVRENAYMKLYFVKDNLAFDGIPPSFYKVNLVTLYNRKKIRKVVSLIQRRRPKQVIANYVRETFGSVSELLTAIRLDSLWLKRQLPHSGHRISYKKLIHEVKTMKILGNNDVDNVCCAVSSMQL